MLGTGTNRPVAAVRDSKLFKVMNTHKPIVTASFVVAGLYYSYASFRDFDSFLSSVRSFFDQAPAWLVNASVSLLVLVPIAFYAVAVAVYRNAKWWLAAAPAVIALIPTLGLSSIFLGVYLVLYYAVLRRPQK